MAFQSFHALRRSSFLPGTSKISASSLSNVPSSADVVSKRAKKESIRLAALIAPLRYEETVFLKMVIFGAELPRRLEARSVTTAWRRARA